MSNKLLLDQPADKSLDAYKILVREMARALGSEADDMTEDEWREDWQAFWDDTPA